MEGEVPRNPWLGNALLPVDDWAGQGGTGTVTMAGVAQEQSPCQGGTGTVTMSGWHRGSH